MNWTKYPLLFIIILTHNCFTQSLIDEENDSQFRIAQTHYSNGLLDQAIVIYDRISNSDYNSKTTISIILKAKILIKQEKFNQAKGELNFLLENYASSKYVDEARMMLAQTDYEEANYFNAVRELSLLIDNSQSDEYVKRAKNYCRSISLNYLSSTQLLRISESFSNEKPRAFLLLLLSLSYLSEDKEFSAKSTLSEIIEKYPESEEYYEAKKLYEEPNVSNEKYSSQNLIGIMLPLKTSSTGEFTSLAAAEILDGIRFAISEFNSGRDEKIGIVVRDTKDDAEIIREIKDEFANNSLIKVVLGPLFSNEVRVTLDEFSDSDLAIISPTATDDDLTNMSENFFQANPSFSKRGIIMAQYIFYVENKRIISILNSIDGYSPLLASMFAEEFERLGGKILKRESYKSKSFLLSEPISKIAEDSLQLEGIYIPLAENVDAPGILSELVRNNLRTTIYGNQDWFTAKGFETSTELSNKLTFSSDYFIDFNSNEFIEFNQSFSSITGKDANRNVMYGYDTAKYLLTVMRNIASNRANIKNKMTSGITSNGIHNNISFDESRVNKFLNIVRYKDGVFELVEKFKSGN